MVRLRKTKTPVPHTYHTTLPHATARDVCVRRERVFLYVRMYRHLYACTWQQDTLPGLAHTSIMDSHLGRLVLPGAWTGAASAGRGVGEVSTWTWGSHNQSVQGAYATGSSSKDHHLGETNRFQCLDVQNSHA